MSEWQDTPEGEAVLAERMDGERVRFFQLRPGDVFKAVAPDGSYVDPFPPFEPSESMWRVADEPWQADGTECDQDFGWCMGINEINPEEIRSTLN